MNTKFTSNQAQLKWTLIITLLIIIPIKFYACQSTNSLNNQDSKAISETNNFEANKEKIKKEIHNELKTELEDELKSYINQRIPPTNNTLTHNTTNTTPTPTPANTTPQPTPTKTQKELQPLQASQKIEKDDDGLKILQHLIATEIQRRQPQNVNTVFSIDTPAIFCFVDVASVYEPERTLTLKWVHSTGVSQSYELLIGQSPAWRTWSKLNITSAMKGRWNCEVFNENGSLLSVAHFTIVDNNN